MITEQQKQLATKFIELLQAEINDKQIEYHSKNKVNDVSLAGWLKSELAHEIDLYQIKQEPQLLYEVVVKRFNENLPNQEEIQNRFISYKKEEATIDFEKAKTYFEDDTDVKIVLNIYELKNTVTEI